jgi:Ca2+-binding RTX toxin-like protein
MTGNLGNDTYVVDNAGDVVIEQVNGGVDQVNTTLNSYTLGTNIENLSFIGAGDFVGVGNGLANVITGSTGNDTLTGGAGNDAFTFQLGFGHDIISDFDASPAGGQDHLDISALGITTATFGGSVTVAASGSDTLVTIGVNSIRLTGIAAAAIDTTDFRLA